ncbi:MAG: branched-chain amino acid transporter AzlC, partial [Erysipelotrichaceae bacterium]|nr:branched-chain amino acid transporter AzlC [Erysipelotrichaceae bacterium]
MFTVIFLEQLLKEKDHYSSFIGLICSIVCLVIFGKDRFLIPAMILIMLLLSIRRPAKERGGL